MVMNPLYFALLLLFSYTYCVRAFLWGLDTHMKSLSSYVLKKTEAAYSSFQETKCDYFFTCCPNEWTHDDFLELSTEFKNRVFGQKIMTDVVVSALKGHLQHSHKSKALAISFHGRAGVGKNYAANIIKEVLFLKKHAKHHVHFFSGRMHFTLESLADTYKIQLRDWIRGNVTRCAYSMFIFDEVDKMPHEVLDAVKPFLDYYDVLDGLDFRKVIFLFISNTGGDKIAEEYLRYWKSGIKRDDLKLYHFEDLIRVGAFNEKGGFYKSEAIESSLIDHYIPFLPLEETHVRNCIHDQFQTRHISPKPEWVQSIVNELTFGPKDNPIFSNGGCKRIGSKVSSFVEYMYYTRHQEL